MVSIQDGSSETLRTREGPPLRLVFDVIKCINVIDSFVLHSRMVIHYKRERDRVKRHNTKENFPGLRRHQFIKIYVRTERE